jgi:hypothetical protein
MKLTEHAAVRSQQRGIPRIVLDLLLQFGCHEYDHAGAEIIYFDRRSKKSVMSYTGGLISRLSDHLDSYAVLVGGTVVTVGTRYKRIRCHQ